MHRVGSVTPRGHRTGIAACAIALVAVASSALAAAPPKAVGALDRIRATGQIRIGYRADARPFSYQDEAGNAAGYSVALSEQIVAALRAELGLPDLKVAWVPVTLENCFAAVQQGQIDLLCGATSATLTRRKEVAFSIPIFPGGIGAVVRADAPARLREVLGGAKPSNDPKWRASAGQLLQAQTFSVIAGTTAEAWVSEKRGEFQLASRMFPVDGYEAGIRAVLDRKANVFFGDRAILLDAVTRDPAGKQLLVIDRLFTYEPLALGLGRNEEDLRLIVDRALSKLYASGGIGELYAKWFGKPEANALAFFRWSALPE
jgi:ABC-type amino acid transport substrate-binding protein